MNKISELISKEVISIYECERVGTICGVCFNKPFTKINGYIIFNDETDIENYISTNKIYALTEEGIIIRNTTKIEPLYEQPNSPINKQAFTINGVNFGKITDAVIDEKSNLLYLVTNKGKQIDVKNIINIGNDMILLKENDEKISINSFKPKETFETYSENDIKVKIVPIQSADTQKSTFPTKIVANTPNLLGKRAKYTLMGLNNEVIIRENQMISDSTIKMAKKHNKLNELAFATM